MSTLTIGFILIAAALIIACAALGIGIRLNDSGRLTDTRVLILRLVILAGIPLLTLIALILIGIGLS